MGCDIHMYAEVRKGGVWEKVGAVFENTYYSPERPTTTSESGYVWNAKLIEHPYDGRNYRLFAILAGVRNYDDWQPIAECRGLPSDVSEAIKKEHDEWGCDAHSCTYLTLQELLEFDWDKVVGNTTRMVSESAYNEFMETGKKPEAWCGHTNSPDWKTLSWKTTYKECTDADFWDAIEALKRLGDPEDVRLVFWFDN